MPPGQVAGVTQAAGQGVERPGGSDREVQQVRWVDAGLATATEDDVACCYARQDKVWVDGPAGEPWEIYTVLEDVEMPTPERCDCR